MSTTGDEWGHAIRVALGLGRDVDGQERLAALLHDTLEDGYLNEGELDGLLSPFPAAAVRIVTRREGEPYTEYIERVCRSENRLAIEIKLSDLRDNIARCERSGDRPRLLRRYRRALARVEGVIGGESDDVPGRS